MTLEPGLELGDAGGRRGLARHVVEAGAVFGLELELPDRLRDRLLVRPGIELALLVERREDADLLPGVDVVPSRGEVDPPFGEERGAIDEAGVVIGFEGEGQEALARPLGRTGRGEGGAAGAAAARGARRSAGSGAAATSSRRPCMSSLIWARVSGPRR